MRFIFAVVCLLSFDVYATPGDSCSSDFNCSMGEACLKGQFQSTGSCARKVDSSGFPTHHSPSTNSIGPKMDDNDMCSFNTDCNIGFYCEKNGRIKGYCIKR